MVEGLEEFIKSFHIEKRIVDGKEYLVLYKAVRMDFGSWWHRLNKEDCGAYRVGNIVFCRKYNQDRTDDCGSGLNVGTYSFARKFNNIYFSEKLQLIETLVLPDDVVCVPYWTNGKIRCKCLKVVRIVSRKSKNKTLLGRTK